jgi:hypothetical protein
MEQVTTGTGPVPEDEALERFGYRQQFVRSLRQFESFAVAFSFISITTGILNTYAFALTTGGTRSTARCRSGSRCPATPTSGRPGWPTPMWAGGSAGCPSRSSPS